jgi:hypothetical protein
MLVPGEVLAYENADDPTSLEVVDPMLLIKDVFEPGGGNACVVRLGPTFGRDFQPKQSISAFGVPTTYLSPFAQKAFYTTTAAKLQNYDALKERVEKKVEEQQALVSRYELAYLQKKRATQEDVDANKYRRTMATQSAFDGGNGLDGGVRAVALELMAVSNAVDASFDQMSMCRLSQIKSAEKQELKKVVVHWMSLVDNVFKFYSGLGQESGTATMSKSEFAHFITGVNIFKDTVRVQAHIDLCFAQANCEDGLAGKDIGDDTNPDDELLRYEFIECLVRLSQVRCSRAGEELEAIAENGVHSQEIYEARLNAIRKGQSTINDGKAHAEMFVCDLPMHQTLERIMSEFVKPAFDAKSTDNEVAQGLRAPDAQALFASNFDLLMVVYKHYACMESIDTRSNAIGPCDDESLDLEAAKHGSCQAKRRGSKRETAARPTMNLKEFQQLIQDSGLSMSGADRGRKTMQKRRREKEERRRRYARGNFNEPEESSEEQVLSNDLTDTEIRIAFSCAQADEDESVTDASELVFAEFVESVARVATLKWETKGMRFIEKVQLALESICGVADLIPPERKKLLVPEVDWESAAATQEKRKMQQRKVRQTKKNKPEQLAIRDEGIRENADERLERMGQRISHRGSAGRKGGGPERTGELWLSRSEPQRRYKEYVSASKKDEWTKQGTTYLPVDGWTQAAWTQSSTSACSQKLLPQAVTTRVKFQQAVRGTQSRAAREAQHARQPHGLRGEGVAEVDRGPRDQLLHCKQHACS